MNLTTQQAWNGVKTMQRRVMAKDSMTTKREFLALAEIEQREFYNWMRKQCGTWAPEPYWN